MDSRSNLINEINNDDLKVEIVSLDNSPDENLLRELNICLVDLRSAQANRSKISGKNLALFSAIALLLLTIKNTGEYFTETLPSNDVEELLSLVTYYLVNYFENNCSNLELQTCQNLSPENSNCDSIANEYCQYLDLFNKETNNQKAASHGFGGGIEFTTIGILFSLAVFFLSNMNRKDLLTLEDCQFESEQLTRLNTLEAKLGVSQQNLSNMSSYVSDNIFYLSLKRSELLEQTQPRVSNNPATLHSSVNMRNSNTNSNTNLDLNEKSPLIISSPTKN